jgi:hypothetical protein
MFFTLEQIMLESWRVHCAATDPAAEPPTSLPVAGLTAVGMFASAASQTITYPLNLVRTRLQTQGVNGRPVEYRGMIDCVASIVRRDGPRGLFVGLVPNLL